MVLVKFYPCNKAFGSKLLPEKQHSGDSGYDIKSAAHLWLSPGQTKLVKCGFKMSVPQGYEAQIRSRSGLTLKNGVIVLNSPGTIDSGWRGEVGVILFNAGDKIFEIKPEDRIAQLVICKLPNVKVQVVKSTDDLGQSLRDDRGFGSTGYRSSDRVKILKESDDNIDDVTLPESIQIHNID